MLLHLSKEAVTPPALPGLRIVFKAAAAAMEANSAVFVTRLGILLTLRKDWISPTSNKHLSFVSTETREEKILHHLECPVVSSRVNRYLNKRSVEVAVYS